MCDNSRVITLSSILGKVLDNLILLKYHDVFSTSDMQFGLGSPTVQPSVHLLLMNFPILPKYIGNMFCGGLRYADDITLLAPTLSGLKNMLNISHQFVEAYDVMFNSTKSKLLFFVID